MVYLQHQPGMQISGVALVGGEADSRGLHELLAEMRGAEIARPVTRKQGSCFPVRHHAAISCKTVIKQIAVGARRDTCATKKIEVALILKLHWDTV